MIMFSLLEQWLIHVPLLLGAYISFYVLKIPDLSIESAYTFGAFCSIFFMGHYPDMHPFVQLFIALSISFIAGGCVGALSAVLSLSLRISHLLSTIMTTGILYSINQCIIGSYYSISSIQNPLVLDIIFGHPELICLCIIGCSITFLVYFLFKTELGFCITAYGINNSFFKHYAVSSSYVVIIGTIIANCLAGVSGYLQAQSSGFVEITMAFNKSLLCLTALIFGKAVFHSSSIVHLGYPLIGGCIYFVIQYGLIFIGFDSKLFTLMQAVTICFILAMRKQTDNAVKHATLGI